MKRWISLVLALLLALSAAAAFAESDTLLGKFFQQAVKESAYRGTVSFSVIGDGTTAIPQETWTLLKALLPQLNVTLEHSTQRKRDEGEASVTFSVSGQPEHKLSFLYDEKLTGLSGDLLDADAVYTAAREWSWTRLLTSPAGEGEAWPPMWKMLLNVLNAPDSWKKRAEPLMKPYETEVAEWMNTFASVSMQMEGGKPYSELACKIPAAEVVKEAKALLGKVYQDRELLSLLKEAVTPAEAEAYLQPGAESALNAMLDQLKMEGSVEIARRHDSSGTALLDRISFPFAQGALFTRLAVSVTPTENGQEWNVSGAAKDGSEFDISCKQASPDTYTGSVELMLPVKAEGASFVVSDGKPQLKPFSFEYSFTWDQGEEAYSLADDKTTQTIRGSLMIIPKGETEIPMQVFSLTANLSSGSSKQSPTHLDGNVSWMDMMSGAAITAQLTSRTVAPFDYTAPSGAEGAVRIDQMTVEERASLLEGWMANLAGFIASAAAGTVAGE